MSNRLNVEAEGGELILKNESGDHVIIPKKDREKVNGMMSSGCDDCIDKYVTSLPIMSDYATDGSIIPVNGEPEPVAAVVDLPEVNIYGDISEAQFDKISFEESMPYEPSNNQYLKQYEPDRYNMLEETRIESYNKGINDKVARGILDRKPQTGRDQWERYDWHNSYTEEERNIVNSSKYENEFYPAMRANNIITSEKAKADNSMLDQIKDPEVFRDVTSSTGDLGRLFPNATNNIESFVNPLVWGGDMAANLGEGMASSVEKKSIWPALASTVEPLATGLMGSFGANSTAKFIKETVLPLGGFEMDIFKGIKSTFRDFDLLGRKLNDLDNQIHETGNDRNRLDQKIQIAGGDYHRLKMKKGEQLIRSNRFNTGSIMDRVTVSRTNRDLMNSGLRQNGSSLEGTLTGNLLDDATDIGNKTVVDLRTGKEINATVQLPQQESIKFDIKKIDGEEVVSRTDTESKINDSPNMNPDYVNTLNSNIDLIENTIPGAKVFGSSSGVSKAGLPHLTNDYDILITQKDFDKIKNLYEYKGMNGPAMKYEVKFGDRTEILDFNIIEETADGMATGKRAQELFRQFHPDEFSKASKQQVENVLFKNIPLSNSPLDINMSPNELLDNVNPVTKTIVDSYEIAAKPTKIKHTNRIDSYINYGDPKIVSEAQEIYAKSLVGEGGSVAHIFSPEAFVDPKENLKILNEIGFLGDPNIVSRDPARMQVALNDFYINNTILSRADDVKDGINSMEALEQSMREWTEKSSGGSGRGAGLNHVKLGDSTWGGRIYSHKQLGLSDLNTNSPLEYINGIKRATDGDYLFGAEDSKILKEILETTLNPNKTTSFDIISDIPKTSKELITNLPYNDQKESVKILNEFAKLTGIKGATNGTYGNSIYSSSLGKFDEILDNIQYGLTELMVKPKSFLNRAENLNTSGFKVKGTLSVGQFKQLKNLLNGGIEKAEARAKRARNELNDLYRAKDDLVANVVDRTKVGKKILKLEDEATVVRRQIVDLYDRIDTANKLQTANKIALSGLTGVALFGAIKSELGGYNERPQTQEEKDASKAAYEKHKAERKANQERNDKIEEEFEGIDGVTGANAKDLEGNKKLESQKTSKYQKKKKKNNSIFTL